MAKERKSEAVKYLEKLRGGPLTFDALLRSLRETDGLHHFWERIVSTDESARIAQLEREVAELKADNAALFARYEKRCAELEEARGETQLTPGEALKVSADAAALLGRLGALDALDRMAKEWADNGVTGRECAEAMTSFVRALRLRITSITRKDA